VSRRKLLDASFLIALTDADDQYHEVAQLHWREMAGGPPPLLTTDYVFCEVAAFLQSRREHGKVVGVGNLLRKSPEIDLVVVDRPLLEEAWTYLTRRPDKTYSLTDCVAFVLMHRDGIGTALTFDHHFVQAGFGIEP